MNCRIPLKAALQVWIRGQIWGNLNKKLLRCNPFLKISYAIQMLLLLQYTIYWLLTSGHHTVPLILSGLLSGHPREVWWLTPKNI